MNALTTDPYCDRFGEEANFLVAHSLRADGSDASEDGMGRGTPLVPVAFNNTGQGFWMDADASATIRKGDENGNGGARESTLIAFSNTAGDTNLSADEHTAPPITQRHGDPGMIAFSYKDYGADAGEVAPTLRVGGHGNEGGSVEPAIAYQCHGSNVGPMGTLRAGNGNETGGVPFVAESAVRRLTPRECERLQGFPDDYTMVTYRGKPVADGPRYKALGNSMAVPCMSWIGERIAMVEQLIQESESAA